MKKVIINLSNRTFYTLISIGVLVLLGVGVYAFGTNDPSVFGHSIGEIDWNSGVISNLAINTITLSGQAISSWSEISGGGGCYTSYKSDCSGDDCCITGFTNEGSVGDWGHCIYANYWPGGSYGSAYSNFLPPSTANLDNCGGSMSLQIHGTAHICCK